MTLLSIVLLGLATATDAFAAALGKGAGMVRPHGSEAIRIGVIFGVVEALTPVIGWILGSAAARYIEAWDHWIAFGLLVGLGLHMIGWPLSRSTSLWLPWWPMHVHAGHVGVMAGRVLGTLIGKRAEIAGGLVLIAVGAGSPSASRARRRRPEPASG